MYSESELVMLPRSVPARVVQVDTDGTDPARRDEAQLLFVVHGHPLVVVDDEEIALSPEDVLFVNPHSQSHIEASEPVQLIAVRFDLHRLAPSLDDVKFRANSSAAGNRTAYRPLVHLLARIIKAVSYTHLTLPTICSV